MSSQGVLERPLAWVDDYFCASSGRISEFLQMQLYLYREDVRLQDYFLMLQLDATTNIPNGFDPMLGSSRLLDWAILAADRMERSRPKKIKVDVLFCPMANFTRITENRFVIRTLLALAQTDAKIACLLQSDAPCKRELESQLSAIGRSGQVIFVDPLGPLASMEARLKSRVARIRGRAAFERMREILAPHGMAPRKARFDSFSHIALFVEAWERLAQSVEFDAVVARCHWNTLCSPVCRTGIERGKRVITFQQGVIGHTLDTPVTASTFVAFGSTSASFLDRLNRQFFMAAALPQPRTKYISGGCLYDTIVALPGQFHPHTLLMVDVPQPRDQEEFYGVHAHCDALLQIADSLLSKLPLLRLIIRPHPYWGNLNLESCLQVARKYPSRCEISHPAWMLEDDLRRSSAVIGIFSGALTVASACGLPSYFLSTEQGCITGDLACFSAGQMVSPEEAVAKLECILTDEHAYASAREISINNAREYYANGSNVELSGTFFENLLKS